ncbi:MAG: tetratricopeptide repeat protein [Lacipirellulaceae bacterium]
MATPRASLFRLTPSAPLAALGLGAALIATTIAAPLSAQQPAAAPAITAEQLIGDSVSDPDSDKYADVAEAIQRFLNRDQLSARTFLERALQKDPKLPPVGVLMAKMHLLSGNAAAVRPALEQAVQQDSGTDPEPFLLLAEEALGGGRVIEADALFEKAVTLIQPFEVNAKRKRQFLIRAYRGRAIVAERRNKWDLALADVKKWLEQDPDDANAHTRLGQAHFMLDKPREGYEAFVKAKSLNAELPSPFVSAAMMYERKGSKAEAMASFDKAFAEKNADETALVAFGQALLKTGDMAKAETVLKRARTEQAESLNVWLLSGVAARMAGDGKLAEQYLMKALSLAPANRDVMNQLALVLADGSDAAAKRRSLEFATVNARVNQDNPDVNITYAYVLLQNGLSAQAQTALRAAVQGGELSPDGNLLLAKMLVVGNDKANAKKLLEAALKNDQGIFVQRDEAKKLLGTL